MNEKHPPHNYHFLVQCQSAKQLKFKEGLPNLRFLRKIGTITLGLLIE